MRWSEWNRSKSNHEPRPLEDFEISENYLQQGRAIMIKNVEACRRVVALGSSIEAVFEVVFSLGFPAQ